jgi:serine phosphatase RsbU (regulator of sigma subunit)
MSMEATAWATALATAPERGARPPGRILRTAAALALLAGAFGLDCASGNEVASSLFYMVGIAFAGWFVGQRSAFVMACLSATAWGIAIHVVGPALPSASVFAWNLGAELAIYLATGVVLARIQRGREAERRLVERLNAATEALTRDAQAVGELQREMLPPHLPELRGYEWQAHYATSSEAGGDYYDFFALPEGRLGVFVGDASGHGAQAAVLMAMMRVLLHTADDALSAPGCALARLGRQIAKAVPPGRFATACYVVLDPSHGRMEFSLAGHPPPIIVRAAGGAIEELPMRGGPPLGLFADASFDAGSDTLLPGDTLIVYTDGLTESADPARELFGVERLCEALRGAEALSPVELRGRILAHLEAHTQGARLEDDLTVLVLRRDA